jgi:hypothetical protein
MRTKTKLKTLSFLFSALFAAGVFAADSAGEPGRNAGGKNPLNNVYYGSTAPKGKEKNWIQTIPGQGRAGGFTCASTPQPRPTSTRVGAWAILKRRSEAG